MISGPYRTVNGAALLVRSFSLFLLFSSRVAFLIADSVPPLWPGSWPRCQVLYFFFCPPVFFSRSRSWPFFHAVRIIWYSFSECEANSSSRQFDLLHPYFPCFPFLLFLAPKPVFLQSALKVTFLESIALRIDLAYSLFGAPFSLTYLRLTAFVMTPFRRLHDIEFLSPRDYGLSFFSSAFRGLTFFFFRSFPSFIRNGFTA